MRLKGAARAAAGVLLAGFALSGCQTVRMATFPDHSYDDVFRAAVTGMCTQKGGVLYEADKDTGILRLQTTGFFTGGNLILVSVTNTTSPMVTVTTPGMNNPWGDRSLVAIQQALASRPKSARGAAAPEAAPAAAGTRTARRKSIAGESKQSAPDKEEGEVAPAPAATPAPAPSDKELF